MAQNRLQRWLERQKCDHKYTITSENIIETPFQAGAVRTCEQCGNPQIRLGLEERFGAFVNISHWNRREGLDEEVVAMALSLAPGDSPEQTVRGIIERAVRNTNNPISLIRAILRRIRRKRSFARHSTRARSGELLKVG